MELYSCQFVAPKKRFAFSPEQIYFSQCLFFPLLAIPHSALKCLISSMQNSMHIFHFITLNSNHLPIAFYQPKADNIPLYCLAELRSQQQTKKLSSHFPHTGVAHILLLCHPASSCLKTPMLLIQMEAAAPQILFLYCALIKLKFFPAGLSAEGGWGNASCVADLPVSRAATFPGNQATKSDHRNS